MLEYSIMSLGGGTKKMINTIEEDILLFDYDKALEKIQVLL
jgi:hypothetical protein